MQGFFGPKLMESSFRGAKHCLFHTNLSLAKYFVIQTKSTSSNASVLPHDFYKTEGAVLSAIQTETLDIQHDI